MIPKQFYIFGQLIKVFYKRTLHITKNAIGIYNPSKNTIELQQSTKKYEINNSNIEQSFCHELVHAWLDKINRQELYKDEILVDNLGSCLHQFIKENYTLK